MTGAKPTHLPNLRYILLLGVVVQERFTFGCWLSISYHFVKTSPCNKCHATRWTWKCSTIESFLHTIAFSFTFFTYMFSCVFYMTIFFSFSFTTSIFKNAFKWLPLTQWIIVYVKHFCLCICVNWGVLEENPHTSQRVLIYQA